MTQAVRCQAAQASCGPHRLRPLATPRRPAATASDSRRAARELRFGNGHDLMLSGLVGPGQVEESSWSSHARAALAARRIACSSAPTLLITPILRLRRAFTSRCVAPVALTRSLTMAVSRTWGFGPVSTSPSYCRSHSGSGSYSDSRSEQSAQNSKTPSTCACPQLTQTQLSQFAHDIEAPSESCPQARSCDVHWPMHGRDAKEGFAAGSGTPPEASRAASSAQRALFSFPRRLRACSRASLSSGVRWPAHAATGEGRSS